QRVAVFQVGDAKRPLGAMQRTGTARVAFRAPEVAADVVPAPARIGGRARPLVVVFTHAADVAHGVDRTGTAKHLAAGPPQPASVEIRLRLGVVVPVVAWILGQLAETGGHVDIGMPIAATGFEQ